MVHLHSTIYDKTLVACGVLASLDTCHTKKMFLFCLLLVFCGSKLHSPLLPSQLVFN
jgi:hypothetical protein